MNTLALILSIILGLTILAVAGIYVYHAIVRRKVRGNFTELSRGNYEHVLSQMAPAFDHYFAGAHPLGGRRQRTETMRRWFERLYRLNKNLRFEVNWILVSGPPWNTGVVVEWIDRAELAIDEPYVNQGTHLIKMRWGKVVSLHAYLDTQVWVEACRRMAEQGIGEANAEAITG